MMSFGAKHDFIDEWKKRKEISAWRYFYTRLDGKEEKGGDSEFHCLIRGEGKCSEGHRYMKNPLKLSVRCPVQERYNLETLMCVPSLPYIPVLVTIQKIPNLKHVHHPSSK